MKAKADGWGWRTVGRGGFVVICSGNHSRCTSEVQWQVWEKTERLGERSQDWKCMRNKSGWPPRHCECQVTWDPCITLLRPQGAAVSSNSFILWLGAHSPCSNLPVSSLSRLPEWKKINLILVKAQQFHCYFPVYLSHLKKKEKTAVNDHHFPLERKWKEMWECLFLLEFIL